jgi:hypothetical protein
MTLEAVLERITKAIEHFLYNVTEEFRHLLRVLCAVLTAVFLFPYWLGCIAGEYLRSLALQEKYVHRSLYERIGKHHKKWGI